jgi:hypothetical protein
MGATGQLVKYHNRAGRSAGAAGSIASAIPAPANPPAGTMTRTLTLQVTEVLFDFDDADFSTEERQLVVDSVVGNMFEVEVFDENNLDEIADAIVEEVTDYSQWCVVSLNYRHILNTY